MARALHTWPVFFATRDIHGANLSVKAGCPLPAPGGWQDDRTLHRHLRETYGDDIIETRCAPSYMEARHWVENAVSLDAVSGGAVSGKGKVKARHSGRQQA